MLENGGPFTLSSDLLNVIQGGDLNLYGGSSTQQQGRTQMTNVTQTVVGPSGGDMKKTEMTLVQQAPSQGIVLSF